MKIYSFILLTILLFTGCFNKQECVPETITRIDIQEVYLPTKPKRPNITCEFSGEGNIPIEKMLQCIKLHKDVIKDLTEE